jgi:hypothetical protein
MAITKFSYEVDPWNSDLPCYLHITSPHYLGTEDAFTVPASPNYPHLLSGTPSRYFLKTSYIIDVSALTGARPCSLYDSTSSVTLTRVTGAPSTNQYRIVTDLTSKRRSIIEFHLGQAGHTINYDMYIIGGLLEETDWNDIRQDVDNLIIDQDDQFSQTGIYSSITIPSAITTYKVDDVCYCGNNTIVFKKNSDGLLYRKSILDVDNATAIITSAYDPLGKFCYIENNKICFRNYTGGILYTKSILDVDNAIAITSSITNGAILAYCGNNYIVFGSNGAYIRRKLTTDVDNATTITSDFAVASSINYVGGNKITYSDSAGGNFYIKNYNDSSNGTAVTTTNQSSVSGISIVCGIGNNQIIFLNTVNHMLYKKSIFDVDNVTILSTVYPWTGSTSALIYVGNGKIVYIDNTTQYLYILSIKDYS